jgi:hypothetical protein
MSPKLAKKASKRAALISQTRLSFSSDQNESKRADLPAVKKRSLSLGE